MSESRDCSLSAHTLQNKNCCYKDSFFRLLEDDFPEEKYKPREKDEDRTTVHYGQRKLFLSEVEFLTNVCSEIPDKSFKKLVVIYAGAAPGIHIGFLSEMFPFIRFVLIDPAKFQVETSEKIEIYQEYFTDEMALRFKEDYSDYLRLFISDIRRFGPGTKLTDEEVESEILEDMNHQMNWYKLLDPFRSLLKFRLPYVENRNNAKTKIEYLDGDIYFQIWPPCSSSETRLYVRDNAKLKSYECTKYENQLFRFNNFERAQCYYHEYKLPGLDHCYDCRAEIYVFEQYLDKFDKITKLNKTNYNICKYSVEEFVHKLNDYLSANKKLLKMIFKKKEYDVRFTDICYGKKADDVFSNSKVNSKFSNNKWSMKSCYFEHKLPDRLTNDRIAKLKERINYPKDKHLPKSNSYQEKRKDFK